MNTATTYYSVGINGKWSNDAVSEEFYTGKGCIVQDSRTNGDKQVFLSSKLIATLFSKQSEQIAYLRAKRLI